MLTLFALLTPNVCSVFNIRFFGRPLMVGKLWECQMEFLSMGKDHTDTTSRLFQMALIMRPLMLIQVKFLEIALRSRLHGNCFFLPVVSVLYWLSTKGLNLWILACSEQTSQCTLYPLLSNFCGGDSQFMVLEKNIFWDAWPDNITIRYKSAFSIPLVLIAQTEKL